MIITFPEYNYDVSKIESTIEKIINLDKYDYSEIDSQGNKSWYNKEREYHRLDGPAIIFNEWSIEYWIDGHLHREDGPAVIYYNGGKEYWEYWKNGHRIR